jgi:AraC-like DNA-binding protein
LVPKDLLPQHRRYSMIFKILCFKGMYLGFALFEMKSVNFTVYDTLRIILNSSLYRAMLKKNINKMNNGKSLLIYDLNLKNSENQKITKNLKNKENNNENFILNTYKILEYLTNHIEEPTDLLKIAKDFNLSTTSLMRKTKQLTGYPLQKLHEKLKIEKAKLLLGNKVLNISEISDQLGYQNQFYFSSVFKKHTGMSPKKWLKFNQG